MVCSRVKHSTDNLTTQKLDLIVIIQSDNLISENLAEQRQDGVLMCEALSSDSPVCGRLCFPMRHTILIALRGHICAHM